MPDVQSKQAIGADYFSAYWVRLLLQKTCQPCIIRRLCDGNEVSTATFSRPATGDWQDTGAPRIRRWLFRCTTRCRIDQHERLKSSLTVTGLVWRQENHADKLREGRDELNEYEGEKRPEAIPDRKVDRLERHGHCHNECYSVEEELVHHLHVSAGK